MSFRFEFSLEVLNHLGRGLYRNFATVVAEAISNSWDAEAEEVRININQKKKEMIIQDNGKGMSEKDFQGKFLKVGYSRRNDKENKSNRKVFGRKGIGKLALLSISDKVTIISKKENSQKTGGIINNTKLDTEIKKDGKYSLEELSKNQILNNKASGTYLKFEGIKDTVNNPEIIKKYLAVLFNFSISDKSKKEKFDIYVNEEKISKEHLKDLHGNTQFLWTINMKKESTKEYNNLSKFSNLEIKPFIINNIEHEIKGYVASVVKPTKLKIYGTDGEFKAGLHLFVNGRLRQENIFQKITSHRIVESYLYGEIHVDAFDEGNDIFTSSREGVIEDDKRYRDFRKKLKEIQREVLKDWDRYRAKEVTKEYDQNGLLQGMKRRKKDAIIDFLKSKEDGELKVEFKKKFLPEFLPKKPEKLVLICHSSKDKKLADKVEQELLNRKINSDKILYTSSEYDQSKIPMEEDIFKYIRGFFIQNVYKNPLVIFVASDNLESSWMASLEAGACWVTRTDHYITIIDKYEPQKPLNEKNRLWITFNQNGEFEDKKEVRRFFDNIYKKMCEIEK